MKTHVDTIIVPTDEDRPEFALFVRHSLPIRPRMCSVLLSNRLRLVARIANMVKNPLECPTRAVGWCEHAADAAHPLASVRNRS
jgi:hypothetical protein